MPKSNIRFALTVLIIQSMLFTNILHAEQLFLSASDVRAPVVEHVPLNGPLPPSALHQIRATVKDNVGVGEVSLFYRRSGDTQYLRKSMVREAQDSDVFSVALGTNDLAAPGIEYYIQATDLAGNSVLYGYAFEPIKISVLSGPNSTADTTDTAFSDALNGDGKEKKKSGSKWIWIALGALAVGAIAAAASGGDDGGGDSGGGDSGTITVSGPVPQ